MKKIDDVVIDYLDDYIKENFRLPNEILVHTYLYMANKKQKDKTSEELHDGEFVACMRDEEGIFHGYPFYPKAHDIYKKVLKNEIKGQPIFTSKEDRERYEVDTEYRFYVNKKFEGKI